MKQDGMNLIGMIMTIGVILVLFMSIYVAVDPMSRISTAKDKAREQDVLLIAKALKEYVLDNKGTLPITGDIIASKKVLCSTATSLTCGADTKTCLTIATTTDFFDNYLVTLPVDPEKTNTADTGYYIQGSGDQIIIGACDYEDEAITYTPRIKATIVVECSGFEFGGYCWHGGQNGQSCDGACTSYGGCIDEDWNDATYEVCENFIDPTPPSGYDTAYTNAAPSYYQATNYCYERFSGISQSCAATPGTNYYRLCACEY